MTRRAPWQGSLFSRRGDEVESGVERHHKRLEQALQAVPPLVEVGSSEDVAPALSTARSEFEVEAGQWARSRLRAVGRAPPQAGKLAADLGADVVVGHSMGANVAIEMVAAKAFSGPVVVISPSFSREDESKVLRVLDRLTTAFGHLPYALMLKLIGSALKGEVPDDRAAALTAEFQKNDPRVVRRGIRLYLQYLDRHGSVAPRLCDSGVTAWVAFGEKNDVGLTDNERAELDSCPHVTLVTVGDASHFMLATHPGRVAELILEAISSAA